MNELEHKILRKFKNEPSRELATSEVIKDVLSDEYRWVREVLTGVRERAQLVVAMRKKGQLHRKVLYYLNKLVKEEAILQTRVAGKGEKYFILNVQKSKDSEKQFFEPQLFRPVIPLEGYEKEGLVHKFGGEAWADRINSVIMDASKFSGIFKLQASVSECFSEVNDGVGIYRFEELIEHGDPEVLGEGLRRLDLEAKDYNRSISLLINVKMTTRWDKLSAFVEHWIRLRPEKIHLIWELDPEGLDGYRAGLTNIISSLAEYRIPLYFKNNRLRNAPCFIGRAGVFRMAEDEWDRFVKSGMKTGLCGVCSIAIDVKRFFDCNKSFQEFRVLVKKAAKSLFLGNWALRERSSERFTALNRLNEGLRAFYCLGSNQLRFWNFPLYGVEADHFLSLLESCQGEVGRFVRIQETILKSCGMPLRFQIALGAAGNEFSKGISNPNCEAPFLTKIEDFFKVEFQEFLRKKERLSRITCGRDELRFMTLADQKGENLMKEVQYLLDHVNIPFFEFFFGDEKGVVKLTSFMR